MAINALLLALASLLSGGAVLLYSRLRKSASSLDSEIHRAAVHQRELAQLLDSHEQLADLQGTTEEIINTGTSTIRSIHKEIANIPFEILETLPVTRDTSRVVKGVHDLTSDGVYASITSINKLVGKRLRKQLKIDDKQKNDSSEPEES